MTGREELLALDEAGLEAAVRECARITAPEIDDEEYDRIKGVNSPRYQNTRNEMARAIRAYLRAAASPSSIVTCCVTGAIPGDGGACGDCDPCLLGEASVPDAVKRLIAEKNSLLNRIGEMEDAAASAEAGVREALREGKAGVVLQQTGTRVVHVYGEKWLKPSPKPDAGDR